MAAAFGWGKTIAGLAKVKVRGLARVRFKFTFAMAAYNLIRLQNGLSQNAKFVSRKILPKDTLLSSRQFQRPANDIDTTLVSSQSSIA